MPFLVDTNIWLELLLSQERAQEVQQLLEEREGKEFAITDFALHSIGIALTRLGRDEACPVRRGHIRASRYTAGRPGPHRNEPATDTTQQPEA